MIPDKGGDNKLQYKSSTKVEEKCNPIYQAALHAERE
jgi:hypothetical protein